MDMTAYAELQTVLGDTLNEVIKMYLQTMPEMLDSLGEQIQDNDANQVFEIAHRIKSSSSSIAAMGIANSAEIIEQAGRNGSTENTRPTFEALRATYEELVPFLTTEINK